MADNNAKQPPKRPYHPTTNPPNLSTDRATIHIRLLVLIDDAENDPSLPSEAFDDFMAALTWEGQQIVHNILREMEPRWPEGVAFPNVVELVRHRQEAARRREEADRVRTREREAAERARERELAQAWTNSFAGRVYGVLEMVRVAGTGVARGFWKGAGRFFPWRS
jgi:hypothetical protein